MRVHSCAGVLQRVFNCAKASAGSVTEAHRPIVGLTRSLHHWSGAELSQCVAPRWGAASALLSPAWSRGLRSSAWLQAAMEVKVPQMGESVSEGTIAAILKKPGEGIKEDDVIAQIETDKVTVDVKYSMKEGGVLTHVLVAVGDTVSVGQVVASVDQGKEAPAAPEQPKESKEPKEQKGGKEPKGDKQKAPVEPKIEGQRPEAAKAEGGPEEAKPEGGPKQSKPEPSKTEPKAPSPQPSKGPSSSKPPTTTQNAATAPGLPPTKPERRVKMTRLRMRVAERLKGAQNTYAMLTTFNEVDMTALMDMRNAYKDTFLERHGVKLGFMSAFVRAAAEALREVPSVNGVIEGDEIVYRDYVDISIAVATPKGLVVPVLRNADSLSFAGVEKSLAALGKKARDGTISIDDMAGGTFTISNGGVYGSMMSTPIINPPQSAILGMHAINQRAMVINGKIEARPMMYVALTYDHRLIDGREAVTFLKKVKDVVEDPRRILLDA